MDGGCIAYVGSGWKLQSNLDWRSPGFVQDDRHPVTCINWNDAEAYVAWLTSKTGKAYRLLSDAEREYVARAGTTTPFWWGSTISPQQANYDGSYTYAGGFTGEWRKATVPVDRFASNPWGLYNVHAHPHDRAIRQRAASDQSAMLSFTARPRSLEMVETRSTAVLKSTLGTFNSLSLASGITRP
jgi:Sulfatase-modifying factor enzyme 1